MKLNDFVFLCKKVLLLDRFSLSQTRNTENIKEKDNRTTHYRIMIINDDTLQKSFSSTITRKKIYVFLSVSFVLTFLLWFLLFAYTPLQAVLPETLNYSERHKLISLKKKVDSLENLYLQNEKFIQQYKNYFVTSPEYEKQITQEHTINAPLPKIGTWLNSNRTKRNP